MLWIDRDGQDEELVLALGIEGWLGFHGLEEYYNIISVPASSCMCGNVRTSDFYMFSWLDSTGVWTNAVSKSRDEYS